MWIFRNEVELAYVAQVDVPDWRLESEHDENEYDAAASNVKSKDSSICETIRHVRRVIRTTAKEWLAKRPHRPLQGLVSLHQQ